MSIWQFFCRLLMSLAPKKERTLDVIESFDVYTKRIETRLAATEKRIDECEEDRNELREVSNDNSKRLDACEQRHRDRDTSDAAMRDEMRALKEIHRITGEIKDYDTDSTHRILGSLAPIHNMLAELCLRSHIDLNTIDTEKKYLGADGAVHKLED